MTDKEFIELLNLYVDREISAEDALRLEKVVATNPRRREIYDQYCRIQKACSMLSEETLDMSSVRTTANVIAFPGRSAWRFGPMVAALAAAAACAVAIVGVRNHASPVGAPAPLAVDTPRVRSVGDTMDLSGDAMSMKPVLVVRLPSDQGYHGSQGVLLADADAPAQAAQLNWIGDIHMSPVSTAATGDFLLNPKADLKAAVMNDVQGSRDTMEPVEMTAFRFQR
jgi:anti-sigma factor RsiW